MGVQRGAGKAGIMLAGAGLQPSSRGEGVRLSGSKRTVVDAPLPDQELVALMDRSESRKSVEGSSAAPIPCGGIPRSERHFRGGDFASRSRGAEGAGGTRYAGFRKK